MPNEPTFWRYFAIGVGVIIWVAVNLGCLFGEPGSDHNE